jgi:5-methylcytosine-specific restriction endonuclease McrA
VTPDERDAKIVELAAAGWSLRKIGAAVGLSHSGVANAMARIELKGLGCRYVHKARELGVECPRGHLWAENLWINGAGRRECRSCRRGRERAKDARKGTGHRGRARYFGVEYELVNPRRVFARDRWCCGICGSPVDQRLKHPDPWSASLDHIVPMSCGGGHLYVNVQCAHLWCNIRKANRGGGEQLALIG